MVTGELITGSRSMGCFIVLEGNYSSPDIFQVLRRYPQNVSGVISVPPATYTVYGYDIEENALPRSDPAVVLDNETVTPTDITSEYTIIL